MAVIDPPESQPEALLALWRRPPVLRLLLMALLAEIGYAVLNISTMPVYLTKDRHFGEDVTSLVIVAFLLSEAVFKGPMGNLADRYGRRKLLILGPSITVFTALATMLVPHNWGYGESMMLIVLRILDGLGAAMLWPAAFALMGDLVRDTERQESMSLLNTCYLIGIALALPIGGMFNDLFGGLLANFTGARTPSLYLASALFAVAVWCAVKWVPRVEAQHAESHAEESHDIGELKNAFRTIPQYLALGFVIFMGIGFPMAIVKIFAEDQFKLSETGFGLLALPGALAMAALSVPMSRYGERIGRTRAVHLGLGLCAIGLTFISSGAFLPFMRSPLALALGGIPLGIGFLLAIPAWYASVSEINPKRRAANIGAIMTAQGLGAIVGTPLGGAAYRYLPAYGAEFGRYSPFLGCALCVGFGWLLSLKLIKAPLPST